MTAHGTPADGGPGGTTPDDGAPGLTYAAAGVDTEAGDLAVELMKDAVRATHGPHVVGGVGGFAGLFDASALAGLRKPLLATSTDGVGTKVAIAQAIDKHDLGWTVTQLGCRAEYMFQPQAPRTGAEASAAIIARLVRIKQSEIVSSRIQNTDNRNTFLFYPVKHKVVLALDEPVDLQHGDVRPQLRACLWHRDKRPNFFKDKGYKIRCGLRIEQVV